MELSDLTGHLEAMMENLQKLGMVEVVGMNLNLTLRISVQPKAFHIEQIDAIMEEVEDRMEGFDVRTHYLVERP
jgi:hypothetical protein